MVHPHRVYPRFLSEQDGPFERCLKEKLAAAFLNDRIIGRAYLARVDLRDGSGESVILGLRTSNYDGWKMLDDIASIFASIFHTAEYLERGGRHQIERINARCRGKQRIVHAHARKQRADGSDVRVCGDGIGAVGWVERSETHHRARGMAMMGFGQRSRACPRSAP